MTERARLIKLYGSENEQRITFEVETHHGGTAISGDFALGVISLGIGFVYRQIASKSSLGPADRFSGLVKLSGHVEVANCRLASIIDSLSVKADEPINLQKGEMEVYVDRIKADRIDFKQANQIRRT